MKRYQIYVIYLEKSSLITSYFTALYSDLHSAIRSYRSVEGDVDVQPGQLSDGPDHRWGARQSGALRPHGLRDWRLEGTPFSSSCSSGSFPLDQEKLIAGVGGERLDPDLLDITTRMAVGHCHTGWVPILPTYSGLYSEVCPEQLESQNN